MTTNNTYDGIKMWNNFVQGRYAVRVAYSKLQREYHLERDPVKAAEIIRQVDNRRWLVRELERYPMHSVIEAAVMLGRPRDWQQLLMEWPHVSQGDRSKIAYTQNEAKGYKDIQTVTSVGKYLTRHFDLPDHIIRDLVSRHGSGAQFKFVQTTAEMIYHLHRGPQ